MTIPPTKKTEKAEAINCMDFPFSCVNGQPEIDCTIWYEPSTPIKIQTTAFITSGYEYDFAIPCHFATALGIWPRLMSPKNKVTHGIQVSFPFFNQSMEIETVILETQDPYCCIRLGLLAEFCSSMEINFEQSKVRLYVAEKVDNFLTPLFDLAQQNH